MPAGLGVLPMLVVSRDNRLLSAKGAEDRDLGTNGF
jgi:hypothetical protein